VRSDSLLIHSIIQEHVAVNMGKQKEMMEEYQKELQAKRDAKK